MKKILCLLTFLSLFMFVPIVYAVEDPLAVPNNRFGIHIIDEHDLDDAARLVNSSGGEWGYVTVVIRKDQMDVGRWQNVMNRMRELRLIPIVRIATISENGVWEKPLREDGEIWAEFLNKLNWPVKNRYVILFNEPNQINEWGGRISPVDYTRIARAYAEEFKKRSDDFFILPAGVDLAAPNGPTTMNATDFFDAMHTEDPDIFKLFDGWTSHSYPNPGFSSSPDNTGKMSVRGYQWEIEYLKDYGLNESTPIFITETGWINRGEDLTENYLSAYVNAWGDQGIVAVTPFLLNYTGEPFEDFSWKDEGGGYLPQYEAVAKLPKIAGRPKQINSYRILENNVPNSLVRNSDYSFTILLENIGQSIWEKGEFEFIPMSNGGLDVNLSDFARTKPGEQMELLVNISTHGISGVRRLELVLHRNGDKLENKIVEGLNIVPPPNLLVFAKGWIEKAPTYNDYTLTIYNEDGQVLEFTNLLIKEGLGQINELYDIVPNQEYDFELSRPYFLRSRRTRLLRVGENRVDFGVLLPIDFNGDSRLDLRDLGSHFASPQSSLYSLIPK